MPSLKNLTSGS